MTSPSATPQTTAPVTKYFAPRARLVDAVSNTLIGDTPVLEIIGVAIPLPLTHLNLISARVTLVNTGVSQLSVTLNNQAYGLDGTPTVPPWLYNKLDILRFGQLVRLDMTYSDGDGPWTKMILAQINDLQFSFAATGAQVTVIGEDVLCLLKRRSKTSKTYPAGTTEEQIVRDVLVRAGNRLRFTGPEAISIAGVNDVNGWVTNDSPKIPWPAITEDLPSITHQKEQTYLDFLNSIAARLDFEVFVDFALNYLPADEPGAAPTADQRNDDNPNGTFLHFEPARSLLGGAAPAITFPLVWGQNLIDFAPKLKMWDLVTSVTLKGSHPNTVKGISKAIDEATEIDAVVAADLGPPADAAKPKRAPLLPATRVRRDFKFTNEEDDKPHDVQISNLGPERGLLQAKAELRKYTREMVSVEASTIGFPSLRAGIHVDVQGFDEPFDGLHYVTKAVHTFDSSGYRTQLTLRRPGMLYTPKPPAPRPPEDQTP